MLEPLGIVTMGALGHVLQSPLETLDMSKSGWENEAVESHTDDPDLHQCHGIDQGEARELA